MDKKIDIKLNHIYPGTPPITKKWMFDDFDPFPEFKSVKPIKKNEEIGDLNFRGDNLRNYLHEYRKFGILFMTPGIENNPEYQPYYSYIKGQINRWNILKNDEGFGSCRRFQMGLTDKTFAIDTIGEYSQCNLIDSSSKVKNPEGKRPPECETCEYKMQAECFPCGSEKMDRCNWTKEFIRSLQEFEQMRFLMDSIKPQQQNCSCDCQKDKNPIYCVKDYCL